MEPREWGLIGMSGRAVKEIVNLKGCVDKSVGKIVIRSGMSKSECINMDKFCGMEGKQGMRVKEREKARGPTRTESEEKLVTEK